MAALAGGLGRHFPLQQLAYLTDGGASIEPLQDMFDTLDIRLAVEAVPLVGTAWFEQAITPFPGPQGHRIDAGAAGDLADGDERAVRGRVGHDWYRSRLSDVVVQAQGIRIGLQIDLFLHIGIGVAAQVMFQQGQRRH